MKRLAGPIFQGPRPWWTEINEDTMIEILQQVLVRLRETQTMGIAGTIEGNHNSARACLQEKVEVATIHVAD